MKESVITGRTALTGKDLAASLRIRQWTKNILLFAALVFAGRAFDPGSLVRSIEAFALFCVVSGAVYVLNDIIDVAKDREHPVKRLRPLASGRVSLRTAWALFILLALTGIPLSFALGVPFGGVTVGYFLLQIAYTLRLKHVVIVDVFVISIGFLLRVIAGALAVGVAVSNWILVCTMLLALFLALSKRRHELTLLEGQADRHRVSLREYSPYLLDQMIGVVTSATLVTYLIFTLSPETMAKFGSNMVLTVPFVLYGIFRYLYLVHTRDGGGRPEETLLTDIPLQCDILAYGMVAILVIYF
ncbi:MAG: decaprenyl-phosphate phosphoribosyltransferase [Candidatus Latescibacterota bacterium]